jgi:hypothetical protein
MKHYNKSYNSIKLFFCSTEKWAELFYSGEFFHGTVLGFCYFSVAQKITEKHGGFLPYPISMQENNGTAHFKKCEQLQGSLT